MWGQIILFGGFVEAGIYDGNMQYENMFDDKVREGGREGRGRVREGEKGAGG